jgi:energy-coupling factor transport system permease protein
MTASSNDARPEGPAGHRPAAATPVGRRSAGRNGWAQPQTPGTRSRNVQHRLTAPQATRTNAIHPGAWWLWALGLGTAASRTIRLAFAVVLGSPIPGTHTLLILPELPLPAWAEGIRIGGRVTAEGLTFALYDGLKLATLLICVGAANALANPARLLKSLPGALYEAGVAVVVALTFAPNLIADVQRLRAARRLRGRPDKGLRGLLQVGLPVLEGALERSVALAAAMDARGYGRTADVPPTVRRTTTALTLGGLVGVCAGTYGLLTAEGGSYGLPVLLAGLAAALAGLWLGGRRSLRTRYRPDAWGVRAWLIAASGAAVATLLILYASHAPSNSAALHPGVVPLTAPTLPLWPAAAILLGLLPAFIAPAPEHTRPKSAHPEHTHPKNTRKEPS